MKTKPKTYCDKCNKEIVIPVDVVWSVGDSNGPRGNVAIKVKVYFRDNDKDICLECAKKVIRALYESDFSQCPSTSPIV